MNMRVVPTSVHGIVDYVTASTLMAAPDIFRMKQTSPAAIAPRVQGAMAATYSTLTDYELGVKRLLPMKAHLAMDAVGGAMLAALPWMTRSHKKGLRYWVPHMAVGVAEIGLALTTQTKAPRGKAGTARQAAKTIGLYKAAKAARHLPAGRAVGAVAALRTLR